MIKGDLVHIPQDAFLIKEVGISTASTEDYLKVKKPLKALFWEKDTKNPIWASVYYKDQIWSVRVKDVYPIIQEIGNAN
tara:strand:- start:3290 stop:3526 length:237 start_codon:yes stop_codon:yes gene_type:complete